MSSAPIRFRVGDRRGLWKHRWSAEQLGESTTGCGVILKLIMVWRAEVGQDLIM